MFNKQQKKDNIKNRCLDVIVSIGVNVALRSIMASITDWANRGGVGGGPAYADDLKGHFRDLHNSQIENVLNQLHLGFLCSPFAEEIKSALTLELAIGQSSAGFINDSTCRIDDILAELDYTVEAFQEDFANGGWAAWLEVVEAPNNRYGVWLRIQEEIRQREEQQVTEDKLELSVGRGFFSKKHLGECIEWVRKTPAQQVGRNSVLLDPTGPAFELDLPTISTDPDIRYIQPTGPDADQFVCTEREPDKIITPGSILESGISKVTGVGVDRILVADEFNEMISALMEAWLNKAITKRGGFAGLSKRGSDGSESETDKLRKERDDVGGVDIPGTNFHSGTSNELSLCFPDALGVASVSQPRDTTFVSLSNATQEKEYAQIGIEFDLDFEPGGDAQVNRLLRMFSPDETYFTIDGVGGATGDGGTLHYNEARFTDPDNGWHVNWQKSQTNHVRIFIDIPEHIMTTELTTRKGLSLGGRTLDGVFLGREFISTTNSAGYALELGTNSDLGLDNNDYEFSNVSFTMIPKDQIANSLCVTEEQLEGIEARAEERAAKEEELAALEEERLAELEGAAEGALDEVKNAAAEGGAAGAKAGSSQ